MKLYFFAFFVIFIGAAGCKKTTNKPGNYNFTYSGSKYTYNSIGFGGDAPVGSTYLWKFGDGAVTTGSSPRHVYNYSGSFIVTMIINGDTAHAVSKSLNIHSTTHKISGNYSSTLYGAHEQLKSLPIDHSIFYYNSNGRYISL